MKLILHIGTEKTGTTTFQNWFSSNRRALLQQGVLYPRSLGKVCHRDLSIFAMRPESPDDAFTAKKIFTSNQHEQYSADLQYNFIREIKKFKGIPYCVISSEHLHSRLTSIEMICKIKDFFQDIFQNIDIYIHFRPQIDVALSLASTASRNGIFVGLEFFTTLHDGIYYYNYNRVAWLWESVFGKANINIIPFTKVPCLTSLLIKKLNINVNGLSKINIQNEALDWRTIALVNSLSQINDASLKNSCKKIPFDTLPKKEKLSIDIRLAKHIHNQFRSSNSKLVARYPDLQSTDLEPNWTKFENKSNFFDLYSHKCIFSEHIAYTIKAIGIQNAGIQKKQSVSFFAMTLTGVIVFLSFLYYFLFI